MGARGSLQVGGPTTLDPILENEDAQAVHLEHFKMPKSMG